MTISTFLVAFGFCGFVFSGVRNSFAFFMFGLEVLLWLVWYVWLGTDATFRATAPGFRRFAGRRPGAGVGSRRLRIELLMNEFVLGR